MRGDIDQQAKVKGVKGVKGRLDQIWLAYLKLRI